MRYWLVLAEGRMADVLLLCLWFHSQSCSQFLVKNICETDIRYDLIYEIRLLNL